MKLNKPTTYILVTLLLVLMMDLAFFSILNDSTTMDELAHIPAGYSYISQKDMRLNPEHPPVLKDLSGLSVWFGSKIAKSPINFPDQVKSWQQDINGQWDFGREFLYKSNNNTDQIIFLARLPMILIMLILGLYVFKMAQEIYGNKAGLIALFLYSLSPTFLAHGRLVTTDVGAAAAFFIATYYLIKWLRQDNKKNLVIAGLVLGLALLTKFSLVILIPYFIILTIAWALIKYKSILPILKCMLLLFLIGIIAMALIWPVYQFHTWNYPAERQYLDTEFNLGSYGNRLFADPIIWMSDKPILRPYSQFFSGLLMVIQRAIGGNTTYFLGEISNTGWLSYFPIVSLIKVPLALLVLILISVFAVFFVRKQKIIDIPTSPREWLKDHFIELALISFFAIYWFSTMRSNLNIGVRHVLPTFPIIYILVSGQIAKLVDRKKSIMTAVWQILIIFLLIWYASGTIKLYPHFLSYFNETVGGPSNGYKYVTDSNLDWGQDLKRLTQFVEENKIETIHLDYFGGDSPEHRLGDKFQPWWGDRNPNDLPDNGWLAVSATFLQGGRGKAVPGFDYNDGYYNWLNQYEPVKIIGNSIFVYQIP